ncbi:hypothetical protein IAQ61_000400 [Plenodomus lingam]|uniref:uncharacterized protein n=1 Tax=Leptosphaeria maculans TaxID=5022 RepID=UPI003324FA47|nr:hypothetical protein IAQ61_000400 [Plenodomus lingam]
MSNNIRSYRTCRSSAPVTFRACFNVCHLHSVSEADSERCIRTRGIICGSVFFGLKDDIFRYDRSPGRRSKRCMILEEQIWDQHLSELGSCQPGVVGVEDKAAVEPWTRLELAA